jgi:hypothetical protein
MPMEPCIFHPSDPGIVALYRVSNQSRQAEFDGPIGESLEHEFYG